MRSVSGVDTCDGSRVARTTGAARSAVSRRRAAPTLPPRPSSAHVGYPRPPPPGKLSRHETLIEWMSFQMLFCRSRATNHDVGRNICVNFPWFI